MFSSSATLGLSSILLILIRSVLPGVLLVFAVSVPTMYEANTCTCISTEAFFDLNHSD